jgi:DNA (cytosine-5)-methyltransferase 1
VTRPLLLDLCCGAGGAARGYDQAGFDVIGVDIKPQPRYPYPSVVHDALHVLGQLGHNPLAYGRRIGAIHASFPCQKFAQTKTLHNARDDHPDLITPGRELLNATGLPWVMENVPEAPLRDPVWLCGTMFGLRGRTYDWPEEMEVQRHRAFETNWPLKPPGFSCAHRYPVLGVYGGHVRDRRRRPGSHARGRADPPVKLAHALMGIDWMTLDELSEAIPPAYTRFVGQQLMEHLGVHA